jgi:hypothetical protein
LPGGDCCWCGNGGRGPAERRSLGMGVPFRCGWYVGVKKQSMFPLVQGPAHGGVSVIGGNVVRTSALK